MPPAGPPPSWAALRESPGETPSWLRYWSPCPRDCSVPYPSCPVGLLPVGGGGAVLAIVVYHRRAPAFLLEVRAGVRIGAVAGLIAAYSSVIATAVWRVFARYVLHQGSAIDQFYDSVIKQSTALSAECPTRTPRHSGTPGSNSLLSPDGRAAYTLMNAATTSLGIILFSAIGGALGVRLLAPRKGALGNG